MHACTRSAHAFAMCTRSCFTHAYKYVYTPRVQPTLVIADSPRSIVPLFTPAALVAGPSCTYKRLHTNIPGISMGGMLIRESTRKFFHYLWILIFRTVALRLAAPPAPPWPTRSNLTFSPRWDILVLIAVYRFVAGQRSMLPAMRRAADADSRRSPVTATVRGSGRAIARNVMTESLLIIHVISIASFPIRESSRYRFARGRSRESTRYRDRASFRDHPRILQSVPISSFLIFVLLFVPLSLRVVVRTSSITSVRRRSTREDCL